MTRQPYASLEEMQTWARSLMERKPDFTIGENYLRRWWVFPRNRECNVYLHAINESDDARAMHDHPWDNRSFLLFGRYLEHTPDGVFERKAGDVVERKAKDMHRLEVFEGEPAISLFMTGPRIRQWGFDCPNGWVPWDQYTEQGGCGET